MKRIVSVLLIVFAIFCVYSNMHFSEATEWTEGNDTKYENAVFTIVEKNNRWGLRVEGIEKIESDHIRVYYTNTDEVPSISELGNATELQSLVYDEEGNYYETQGASYIDRYVQSAEDVYAWVIVKELSNNTVTLIAQSGKMEKPEFEKYYKAFNRLAGMSDSLTTITFDNMGDLGDRKFQVKIGKISDINTLSKLKNDDKSEWEQLLRNAKTSNDSVVYDENVEIGWHDAITHNGYNGGGSVSSKEVLLKDDGVSKLEDSCFYYVYVSFDDENGKYRPIECVTVAKAFVNTDRNSWHLSFFNCDGDFNWDSVPDNIEENKEQTNGEEQKDEKANSSEEKDSNEQTNTESSENKNYANTKLPQTGEPIKIILGIFVVIVMLAVVYKKNKKIEY